MTTETQAFIECLWGSGTEDHHTILLWTLQGKRSSYFEDAGAAAAHALSEAAAGRDVYIGVALRVGDLGAETRGKLADCVAVAGVWADIDVYDPRKPEKHLPTSKDEARAWLLEHFPRPTILLDSGHGLQAHWLYPEVWTFEDARDQQEAAALSKAWAATIKGKAAEQGWQFDGVGDLPRIMRIPGTVNAKDRRAVVPVVLLEMDEQRRYDRDHLESLLLDTPETVSLKSGGQAKDGGQGETFTIDLTASPPVDKWDILSDTEPRAKLAYQHKGRYAGDRSAADLALANYAARQGWTDQEIVNLGISSHRRNNMVDAKTGRVDYWQRTIGKARKPLEEQRAVEQRAEEALEAAGGDEKAAARALVSALLGVEVQRFVKYESDSTSSFRVETDRGSVNLGEMASVLNQTTFRARWAGTIYRVLPKMKASEWEPLVQSLLDIVEVESIGEDATEKGQARVWLRSYLSNNTAAGGPDEALAHAEQAPPFIWKDRLHIIGISLRAHLKRQYGETVDAKTMGSILRAYGCKPVAVPHKTPGGKTTTLGAWQLPDEYLEMVKPAMEDAGGVGA